MYILFAKSEEQLNEKTKLFDQYMEPLLERLDQFHQSGQVPNNIIEIPEYLKVCRFPFRRLEYSFVLSALVAHLKPGDVFLDAGSGATPLAYAISKFGINSFACDGDYSLIEALQNLPLNQVYGSSVNYEYQDLTKTNYPSDSFDAISCVSVLEHIPAPHDRTAVEEMLRLLKPGGILISTVDFTPGSGRGAIDRWRHYIRRVFQLARKGDVLGIAQSIRRKAQSEKVVQQGLANLPRSANQCFTVDHLEMDILPNLSAIEIPSSLNFSTDLRSIESNQAKEFWKMEGHYNDNDERDVLPVAMILKKV